MIPHDIRRDLTEAIRKQVAEMDSALSEKMGATQSDGAGHGLVHSEEMMRSLTEDAIGSLRARAVFILTQFLRRTAKHLNADTLSETSYFLRETVEAQSRSILARLASFPLFAAPDLTEQARQYRFQIDRETHSLVARMTAELRTIAAEAQYRESSPYSTKVATLANPVGAVPMPDDSPAPTIPRLNSGTRQQISTALQLYLEELNKPESSHLGRAGELRELIRDTSAELNKPQPNALKVNANLRTIAETTKFVGSLNPAYQTLLTFLAFTYRS